MSLIRIDSNPSRRQLNVFGLIWLVFFGIVGGIVLASGGTIGTAVLWGLAAGVPATGWVWPRFMRLVYVGMAYAAFPIGFVVSYLVLTLLYYLVITPTGLLMRLFGHDPMNRRFDPNAESYWSPREQREGLDGYFKQF